MKSFILILLLAAYFTPSQSQIKVNLHLQGGRASKNVILRTPDTTFTIQLDSAGKATRQFILDKKHTGYGQLSYGVDRFTLFFCKSFDCHVTLKIPRMEYSFAGAGSEINRFVSKRNNIPEDIYKLGEEEFLNKIAEGNKERQKELDKIKMPKTFKKIEQVRQYMADVYNICDYPKMHASLTGQADMLLSPGYFSRLESYFINDPIVLAHQHTEWALTEAVQKYVQMKQPEIENSPEELERQVGFVLKNFTNPAIRSSLIETFVLSYAHRNGVAKLGGIREVFDNVVTDAGAKKQLQGLYEQNARMQPGQPSPEFNYNDINGKPLSLRSLRGKYVFIDVWATWCAPCLRELPHLQKLEHKYKDKNIEFISIAIDKDFRAWENMVREKEMQGIQLHVGKDHGFIKAYDIKTIPRFILLDPEGRIVNAQMTVPSNPQTVQFIDQLQGL